MTRARDLGLALGTGTPGPANAITDVPGVRVGHCTRVIAGEGALEVGRGPVRTGVTVVVPRPEPAWEQPAFAGAYSLNGNGELTGLAWLREAGLLLTSPIALTSTHAVGAVHDALIGHEAAARPAEVSSGASRWSPRPGTASSTTSTAVISGRARRVRARLGRPRRRPRGERRRWHRDDLPRIQGRDRNRLARSHGD